MDDDALLLPERPTQMRTPADWLKVIQRSAVTAIREFGGNNEFTVGTVKHNVGASIGPDERCGTLALDVSNWYPTSEPWPSPKRPQERPFRCGDAIAVVIAVRYVTCVTTMSNDGAPQPMAVKLPEQDRILELAWDVWGTMLAESVSDWAKHFGSSSFGGVNRLPEAGGGAGFAFSITCKLTLRC